LEAISSQYPPEVDKYPWIQDAFATWNEILFFLPKIGFSFSKII
jgi:hypothetical protein